MGYMGCALGCGQLFCGECTPKLVAAVPNCPTCRAPFLVSDKESFAQLWKLVHDRTPGRHTADAQCGLGAYYRDGTGVRQDDTEAVKWCRLAAEGGDAGAQIGLGVMHEQGKGGLKQDDVEAARWYALAAAQNHPVAQYNLGVLYEQGTGVAQDDTKAVELWTLAAEQGVTLAQSDLGVMHVSGRGGLPQDFAQAAMWWKRAADQGEEDAIKYLRMVLDEHLFPPGTAVQLVDMKAAILDGKRGVVVAAGDEGAPPPALGKVMVRMDGNGRMQATCFENLERV